MAQDRDSGRETLDWRISQAPEPGVLATGRDLERSDMIDAKGLPAREPATVDVARPIRRVFAR